MGEKFFNGGENEIRKDVGDMINEIGLKRFTGLLQRKEGGSRQRQPHQK